MLLRASKVPLFHFDIVTLAQREHTRLMYYICTPDGPINGSLHRHEATIEVDQTGDGAAYDESRYEGY